MASSRSSRRGLVSSAPADGQHLLLAARKLIAAIDQALREPGKQLQHARHGPRLAPSPPAPSGDRRGSRPRSGSRKCRGPPAHRRCRGARWQCVGGSRHVLAVEQHLARCGAHRAHERADQRGLAHAVAAHQADGLARARCVSDTPRSAGSGRSRCRARASSNSAAGTRGGITRGLSEIGVLHRRVLARIAAGLPAASTVPSAITVIQSATANTKSMSCSISSTGMLARQGPAAVPPCAAIPRRPYAGAAARRATAPWRWPASAMAISSWRCSPCDRVRRAVAQASAEPDPCQAGGAAAIRHGGHVHVPAAGSARGTRDRLHGEPDVLRARVQRGKMLLRWNERRPPRPVMRQAARRPRRAYRAGCARRSAASRAGQHVDAAWSCRRRLGR